MNVALDDWLEALDEMGLHTLSTKAHYLSHPLMATKLAAQVTANVFPARQSAVKLQSKNSRELSVHFHLSFPSVYKQHKKSKQPTACRLQFQLSQKRTAAANSEVWDLVKIRAPRPQPSLKALGGSFKATISSVSQPKTLR